MVGALRLDLIAQLRIRRGERMSDHVFWQATLRQEDAAHTFEASELRACIADLSESMPVLAQRMRHVRNLLRIAGGDIFGFDAQIDALPAAATGCPPCARQDAQVELALAALAVGRADLAERALAGAGRHHAPRWNLGSSIARPRSARHWDVPSKPCCSTTATPWGCAMPAQRSSGATAAGKRHTGACQR